MPTSDRGHKFILCIIDEVTNCLITVPTHQSRSDQIDDASVYNVISKFCIPAYIIMDQDSVLMSFDELFTMKLNIKIYSLFLQSSVNTSRTC